MGANFFKKLATKGKKMSGAHVVLLLRFGIEFARPFPSAMRCLVDALEVSREETLRSPETEGKLRAL